MSQIEQNIDDLDHFSEKYPHAADPIAEDNAYCQRRPEDISITESSQLIYDQTLKKRIDDDLVECDIPTTKTVNRNFNLLSNDLLGPQLKFQESI